MAFGPVWASIWPILTTSCAATGVAARSKRASSETARVIRSPLVVEGSGATILASEGQPLGDDLLHDLGRARGDGVEPHVPEEALHRELPHVAVAAVHLDGLVGDAVGHLRREELGHGHLGDAVFSRA